MVIYTLYRVGQASYALWKGIGSHPKIVSQELRQMLASLKKAGKVVIGVKQTTKAVNKGLASRVLLANDVADGLLENIKQLCQEKGIKCKQEMTRQELGSTCGIKCEASAVAVLK